jgi:hypothetical protein
MPMKFTTWAVIEASLPSLVSVENLAVECFIGYPYRQENPQQIWKVTGRQGWNSVYSARRVSLIWGVRRKILYEVSALHKQFEHQYSTCIIIATSIQQRTLSTLHFKSSFCNAFRYLILHFAASHLKQISWRLMIVVPEQWQQEQ